MALEILLLANSCWNKLDAFNKSFENSNIRFIPDLLHREHLSMKLSYILLLLKISHDAFYATSKPLEDYLFLYRGP